MKTLKVGMLNYEIRLNNKVFYQAHDGRWSLSSEQKEVKELFKVMDALIENWNMTYKTMASSLGWSVKKARLVCNVLIANNMAYINDGVIYPKNRKVVK